MEPTGPQLLHRRDAILAGITDADLRRERQRNNLVHIARGSYLPEPEYRELHAADQHRARVVAAAHRHGHTAVFSHISAAVLHGFDVWNVPLKAVHVTRKGSRHGRRSPNVHHHPTTLEPEEIVEVDGFRVTSRPGPSPTWHEPSPCNLRWPLAITRCASGLPSPISPRPSPLPPAGMESRGPATRSLSWTATARASGSPSAAC